MRPADVATEGTRPRGRAGAAFLLRAYLFIAVLVGAAHWARELNAAWLLALAIVLAVPAALALWHRAAVNCLLSLHQFRPGRALHWIASRLVLRKIFGAALALLVALSSILHSSFFEARDWVLLALMPAVFAAARVGLEGVLRPQLAGAAYATRATLRLAGWAVALAYMLGWVGLAVAAPDAAPGDLLERVEALQAPWQQAPAASARHAADAMAWATAALESAELMSQTPLWRVVLGVVVAPMATVLFVALAMQGLALPAEELRRNFSPGPSSADVPPPIAPLGAGVHAAVTVLFLLVLFQLAAHVEHVLKGGESLLSVRRLPECEAIEGKVYKLGTLDSIAKALAATAAESGRAQASTCAALDSTQAAAERPVEAYLDWYFSLQAEWMRMVKMLTGDLEQLMSDRLAKELESAPGLAEALKRAQGSSRIQADALDVLRGTVRGILADNVLVLDERACRVVRRDSIAQTLAAREEESLRLRTAGSAGVGLAAGVVAGKVAAKAMAKGSMKAAAKVLAKFVAKKAATMTLSTGTGMAVGSVIPGLGTAAGAAVGAVAGLVISVGVDWAALAAEERLERDAMKAELLEAVRETLAPTRAAMACPP